MAQHGGSKATAGRTTARKKKAVSFIIREVEEPLNRAGVNTLRVDPANQMLCTAGRDSVIRLWDIQNSDKGKIKVSVYEGGVWSGLTSLTTLLPSFYPPPPPPNSI